MTAKPSFSEVHYVAIVIVALLLLFALVVTTAMWGNGLQAELRRSDAELVRAEAQLRFINAGCVRNDAGEGVCRSGTFMATSSTSTTVQP